MVWGLQKQRTEVVHSGRKRGELSQILTARARMSIAFVHLFLTTGICKNSKSDCGVWKESIVEEKGDRCKNNKTANRIDYQKQKTRKTKTNTAIMGIGLGPKKVIGDRCVWRTKCKTRNEGWENCLSREKRVIQRVGAHLCIHK